jgi:sarcosine oxidase subunit beta
VKRSADAVVIGGGALGCATAYYLAQRGQSVVVLEKGEICEGASSRNTGAIHVSGKDPADQVLAREAARIFLTLHEELGAGYEYRRTGAICLIQREQDLDRRMRIMQRDQQAGIEVHYLQPEQVVQVAPALSTNLIGAVFCPTDGQLNPIKLTLAYAEAAKRLGAEIRNHTPATGLQMQGDRIDAVDTPQGPIATHVVVNAAGAHAQQVLAMAGLELNLPPKRSFMMITEPCPHLLDAVIGLGTGDFTARQAEDGKFHVGSRGDYGFEMAGFDLRPTHRMIQWVSQRMVGIMPVLHNARVLRAFGGLVSYPDDMLALLGPVKERPGFFLATGFYGGICYAPVVGQSIAELITEGKSEMNLERFRFERLFDPAYQHRYEGILVLTEKPTRATP